MAPVLLQEETGVPGENLRCLVETNWTTLFSHVTKVILISHLVTVVRGTCTTTVLSELQYSVVLKFYVDQKSLNFICLLPFNKAGINFK